MGKIRQLKSKYVVMILSICLASLVVVCAPPSYAQKPTDELSGINVTIAEDGTVTGIEKSTGKIFTPNDDASSLPFRIVVTYSRDGKVSSDPRIINGYSGPVRMDVAVYNTTGKTETISADIDGKEVARRAVISTPLTIAGSAELSDVDPDRVYTEANHPAGQDIIGNGILGKNDEGTTTVQWAALTGIDPLGSVARFSLVVDADKFTIPVVNLAIAPGFGVQGVSSQDENDLVISTLQTLSQAGKILDESGQALEQAHNQLTQAGSRIGSQTINDLQISNSRIEENARATVATLSQVSQQASATFENTGSVVAQQLAQTTQTVKELLGDPEDVQEIVHVDGAKCQVTTKDNAEISDGESEKTNGQATTVLAVIRNVSQRLEGLAQTTGECQAILLQNFQNSLGTEAPDEDKCDGEAHNLTCALYKNQKKFQEEFHNLTARNSELAQRLRADSRGSSFSSIALLEGKIRTLQDAISTLGQQGAELDVIERLGKVDASITDVKQNIGAVRNQVGDIHKNVNSILETTGKQTSKIDELKKEICLASGLTQQEGKSSNKTPTIDKKEAQKLVGLLSDTDCPQDDPGKNNSYIGKNPTKNNNNLAVYSSETRALLQEMYSETNTELTQAEQEAFGSDLVRAMNDTDSTLAEMATDIELIKNSYVSDTQTFEKLITNLKSAADDVSDSYQTVQKSTTSLQEELQKVAADLEEYVDSVTQLSQEKSSEQMNGSLKSIKETKQHVNELSNTIFGRYSQQLKAQAPLLSEFGTKVVDETNGRVQEQSQQLATKTQTLMKNNSAHVQEVAAKAVADSDAVAVLLSQDIAKVLVDIGNNTNNGGGLLGVISTSSGYLKVADSKMSDASSHAALARSHQRASYGDSLFADIRLRASLARLEKPLTLVMSDEKTTSTWMNVWLKGSNK